MKSIPVRVAAAETIAQDIRLLKLEAVDRQGLPQWDPGSHIDLHLAPGLIRQYSLCGNPNDVSNYQVAVKLEPQSRGGSRLVHESLAVGSEFPVSIPRNLFPMAGDARHSILLAAGIGITPIISMARALAGQGAAFELLYFARSKDHAAFRAELEDGAMRDRCQLLFRQDRDGVEAVLGDALRHRPEGSHLYLCGPKPFMDTVRAVAARCGWPEESVHLEYFAGAEAVEPGAQTSFEVRLARSNATVTVPAGKTIVDVLRDQGVDVPTSCEQGVCGTCVTQVLEGIPDHHDCFLTAKEKERGDCMAICISRSRSSLLVLDL